MTRKTDRDFRAELPTITEGRVLEGSPDPRIPPLPSLPAARGESLGDYIHRERPSDEGASEVAVLERRIGRYESACRALLSKRLPARRVSEADLDIFEREIARIEGK